MQQGRLVEAIAVIASVVVLSSCGGGGGGGNNSSVIPASSAVAQQCAPDNPYVADALANTTTGTLSTEKSWIHSYMDEAYLWYDQVPSLNSMAAAYVGSMTSVDNYRVPLPLSNYFYDLRTLQRSASGAPVDKFSFSYPTKAWNLLAQSGVDFGYGIEWARISNTVPRSWRIAMVQPNSPAASRGLQRGDTLIGVDGVDFVNGWSASDINVLNASLFPTDGTSHAFVFSRSGAIAPISVPLAPSNSVVIDPVPLSTVIANGGHTVGYLVFTDHIASSESKLIAAINNFKAQGVTDLILDLRYNGGGYLYIASELAYMIAGPAQTSGKYFEKRRFNVKRTADNAQAPTYFENISCILDSNYFCTDQQALPTLNLGRVYVLTQGGTCSASEAIINGLMGVDVQVIQIGGTTCGKPYGFRGRDNCGITYFPIEFQGVNFKDFGDYTDGFTPVTLNASGANLMGCPMGDDLDSALGSANEKMLHMATTHIATGVCAPVVAVAGPSRLVQKRGTEVAAPPLLPANPMRQNRILLRDGGGTQ